MQGLPLVRLTAWRAGDLDLSLASFLRFCAVAARQELILCPTGSAQP